MSELTKTFDVGDEPEVSVSLSSGDVIIKEGSTGRIDVRVEGSDRALGLVEIEDLGGVVSVRERKGGRWSARGVSAVLNVPDGTSATVKTASGDVRVAAPMSDVSVNVASGDVRVEAGARDVRIKSASGDVTVATVLGDIAVASASGDVRIQAVDGDLALNTASGDVDVGRAAGSVRAKSASGDVEIATFAGSKLQATSLSGDVVLGLPSGLTVDVDIQTLSGSIRNRLPSPSGESSGWASLKVKTVSGDVVLRGAE